MTMIKCIGCDPCYIVRYPVFSGFLSGNCYQIVAFPFFFIQDSIHSLIYLITTCYLEFLQISHSAESIEKCCIIYGSREFKLCNACSGEYICPQFLYAISQFYIYQLRIIGKRIVSNTRYIVSNRYFLKIGAI